MYVCDINKVTFSDSAFDLVPLEALDAVSNLID